MSHVNYTTAAPIPLVHPLTALIGFTVLPVRIPSSDDRVSAYVA